MNGRRRKRKKKEKKRLENSSGNEWVLLEIHCMEILFGFDERFAVGSHRLLYLLDFLLLLLTYLFI